MADGVATNSPDAKTALEEGLEPLIEDASRLLRLVSLVNYKLAYEEQLPKYFEPVQFSDGAIVLRECATLQI